MLPCMALLEPSAALHGSNATLYGPALSCTALLLEPNTALPCCALCPSQGMQLLLCSPYF